MQCGRRWECSVTAEKRSSARSACSAVACADAVWQQRRECSATAEKRSLRAPRGPRWLVGVQSGSKGGNAARRQKRDILLLRVVLGCFVRMQRDSEDGNAA